MNQFYLYTLLIIFICIIGKKTYNRLGILVDEKVEKEAYQRLETSEWKIVNIQNAEHDENSPFFNDKFNVELEQENDFVVNKKFYLRVTLQNNENEKIEKWIHSEFFFSVIIFFVVK